MNKKFFTFLAAGALLLSSATVSAWVTNPSAPAVSNVGADALDIVPGMNRGLYHIAEVDGANLATGLGLAVSSTGVLELTSIAQASLTSYLWCVNLTTEAQGKNPSFEFTNKFYGDLLRAEAKNVPAVVEGEIINWKFSTQYGVDLQTVKPLYSHLDGTNSLILVREDGTNNLFTVKIATSVADNYALNYSIVPFAADIDDDNNPSTPDVSLNVSVVYFSLREAVAINLSAADFNTVLGLHSTAAARTLDSSPIVPGNPFLNSLLATDVAATPALVAADVAARVNYLTLQKGSATGDYLRVDTSYVNNSGDYYLNYKFTRTIEDGTVPAGGIDLSEQYHFRFIYLPTHDSLIINVKSASTKQELR